MRWSLDLQARTAWYYLFDGSPTGSEYLEEGDFEWAVEMNVRDAGAMPLTSYPRFRGSVSRLKWRLVPPL